MSPPHSNSAQRDGNPERRRVSRRRLIFPCDRVGALLSSVAPFSAAERSYMLYLFCCMVDAPPRFVFPHFRPWGVERLKAAVPRRGAGGGSQTVSGTRPGGSGSGPHGSPCAPRTLRVGGPDSQGRRPGQSGAAPRAVRGAARESCCCVLHSLLLCFTLPVIVFYGCCYCVGVLRVSASACSAWLKLVPRHDLQDCQTFRVFRVQPEAAFVTGLAGKPEGRQAEPVASAVRRIPGFQRARG